MIAVAAAEFAGNFGQYRERAQREPIAVTDFERTIGYFVSAREYEELQHLKRRVIHIDEAPEETIEAMKATRMDPAFDHLNALLDEG